MSEQDAWFHRIKAAQRDLIERCGGIGRAAEIGRVSVPHMGRFNNPHTDDIMPARLKARLEADAQFPVVTKVELEMLGWSACQVAVAPAEPDLHASTARVVAEASDVMRVYAEATKDGKLTPAEVRALQVEFSALARVLEDARLAGAALLALVGGLKHD